MKQKMAYCQGEEKPKFIKFSLKVRGSRAFEKRKAIFNWLIKQNADICLQESYNTNDVANCWRKQWPGESSFANRRGVTILIRKSLDFKITCKST